MGEWIILTTKLPTEVSPPMLSIHFSGTDAENISEAERQKCAEEAENLIDVGEYYVDAATGYCEPKEDGAVWIVFDGCPLKVFPHEYKVLSEESLETCLFGEDGLGGDLFMSHEPRMGRKFLVNNFSNVQHAGWSANLFETACSDGCNVVAAIYLALGVNPEDLSSTLPRDLWFSLTLAYSDYMGYDERDMEPKWGDVDGLYTGWDNE